MIHESAEFGHKVRRRPGQRLCKELTVLFVLQVRNDVGSVGIMIHSVDRRSKTTILVVFPAGLEQVETMVEDLKKTAIRFVTMQSQKA